MRLMVKLMESNKCGIYRVSVCLDESVGCT